MLTKHSNARSSAATDAEVFTRLVSGIARAIASHTGRDSSDRDPNPYTRWLTPADLNRLLVSPEAAHTTVSSDFAAAIAAVRATAARGPANHLRFWVENEIRSITGDTPDFD